MNLPEGSEEEAEAPRRFNFSSNAILAASIAAAGSIVAAFITGLLTGNSVDVINTPRSPGIANSTVTVTARATVTATTPIRSPRPSLPPNSSPRLGTASISLLQPVDQSGWSLAWHKEISIGSAGVVMALTGPQAGTGSKYDLQYIPGGENGWRDSDDAGYLMYWTYKYHPGPATIDGMIENAVDQNSSLDPYGMQAHAGDRISYQNVTSNIIGYMQVIRVTSQGVVVDAWLWDNA
jgi:hypothetical protein